VDRSAGDCPPYSGRRDPPADACAPTMPKQGGRKDMIPVAFGRGSSTFSSGPDNMKSLTMS
jgi:hypothetical protein